MGGGGGRGGGWGGVVDNGAADILSLNDLPSFQSLVPETAREPNILSVYISSTPDWTQVDWIKLCSLFL